MKFLPRLFFLAVATAIATATPIAEEEVGSPDNGCVESIPEGESPANYTICREHPNGHTLPKVRDDTNRQSRSEGLQARSCWKGHIWGCSEDGWCYARCDPKQLDKGKWCWTAVDYGKGRWASCSVDSQCSLVKYQLKCGGKCSC
ncbi:hypothetical protein BKA66DRAFT_473430 [Pyrenochaeta sp. MPI-SDFR-AT-0127]|nr:hypothetical protein BKA66DRAFT_473430 [Pyrenochaeta sp. MPI-SDFR-AT-0127]